MTDPVTDIWFRTPLSLVEIAHRLDLQDITDDAEDHWAWVIGSLGEIPLDITRTHTKPASSVDTRIFILEGGPFPESLITELVDRLREFITGKITCGRWVYRSGNDFDRVVSSEFDGSGAPGPESR